MWLRSPFATSIPSLSCHVSSFSLIFHPSSDEPSKIVTQPSSLSLSAAEAGHGSRKRAADRIHRGRRSDGWKVMEVSSERMHRTAPSLTAAGSALQSGGDELRELQIADCNAAIASC